MMSMVEVKCPHCGAHGQILLPPLGAIIVGPCPQCEGMVAIFCGKVLPLDREIMRGGKLEEKKEHLLEVLGVFLHERIERLLSEQPAHAGEPEAAMAPEPAAPARAAGRAAEPPPYGKPRTAPISQPEFEDFVRVDLQMIDNPEYFRAVFS